MGAQVLFCVSVTIERSTTLTFFLAQGTIIRSQSLELPKSQQLPPRLPPYICMEASVPLLANALLCFQTISSVCCF